jgi:hypothetical protein
MYAITTGTNNSGLGVGALQGITTGTFNTSMGMGSLESLTTGTSNVALGYEAGYNTGTALATGTYCTYLGFLTTATSDGLTDSTAIGDNATITASHQVVLGANTVTSTLINGAVSLASNTYVGATNQNLTPTTTAVTESANAATFNWALGNTFSITLNGNLSTVTFSNPVQGQTIVIAVTNTASNYTVTWGNSVKWSGGSQPSQTNGAVTDVWTFIDIGGTLYGSVVQNMH